jgi:hypothetical protein
MSHLTEDEIEDAYTDWYFLGDNAWRMVNELEDKGYHIVLLNTDPSKDLSELGEYAVITDEFPLGDIVFLKRIGDPRIWGPRGKLGLIPITLDTQRRAKAAGILAQIEEGDLIELYSKSHEWAAAIHPCARPGCVYQGSMFDKYGPHGHVEADTIEDALRQLFERASDWELSPGVVDEIVARATEKGEFKHPLHRNPPPSLTAKDYLRVMDLFGQIEDEEIYDNFQDNINKYSDDLLFQEDVVADPYIHHTASGRLKKSTKDKLSTTRAQYMDMISMLESVGIEVPKENPPFSGWRNDWWLEKMPNDMTKIAYRRKRDALNVFMDWNQSIIDLAFNGPSQVHPYESFDNINSAYGLKGKRRINTFAKAVWFALPAGGPYYLEDINVDMLNDTTPMINNAEEQLLRIPDYAEERRLVDLEAAYWESKYGGMFPDEEEEEFVEVEEEIPF